MFGRICKRCAKVTKVFRAPCGGDFSSNKQGVKSIAGGAEGTQCGLLACSK
jgi:hypothetical protein